MDDPLVENPKFFRKIFLFWGWEGKRPLPPLGELKAFWGRYFGVQKILGILDSKPWPPKSHNHREGWE